MEVVEVGEVGVVFFVGGEAAHAGVVQSGGVEARPAFEAVDFAVAFEFAGVHGAVLVEGARDGLALSQTGHGALDVGGGVSERRVSESELLWAGFVSLAATLGCSKT